MDSRERRKFAFAGVTRPVGFPTDVTYAGYLKIPGQDRYGDGQATPDSVELSTYWIRSPGMEPGYVACEWMRDVSTNPRGFNDCTHTKVSPRKPPPRLSFHWFDGGDYEVWGEGIPPDPASDLALLESSSPTSAQLSDFAWQAYWHAVTQIEEQVNIGNLLWELPEVRNLGQMLTGLKGLLGNLRDALGALSGTLLGYQFGAKPLAEDLGKLTGFYTQIKNRIAFLRATRGKVFTVKFQDFIRDDYEDDQAGEWLEALSPYDVAQMYLTPTTGGYSVVHRLVAILRVENRLEGLDELEAQMDAFAAGLGLNQPMKILWDATKLSFLVEWVVNLDNVFSAMATNPVASPFRGELVVLDQHWSCKTTCTREIVSWKPDPSDPYICKRTKYDEVVGSTYIRRNGLPFGNFITPAGELSEMQKALIAALTVQRTPNSSGKTLKKRLKALEKVYLRLWRSK